MGRGCLRQVTTLMTLSSLHLYSDYHSNNMKLQVYLPAKQAFSTKYCSKCKPLTSNFIFLVGLGQLIYRVVEKELCTFIWIKALQL